MSGRIKIVTNELIEYSQLMDSLTRQSEHVARADFREIINRTKERITGLIQGDLDYFIGNLLMSILIRDMAERKGVISVEKFLSIINTMEDDELADAYYMAIIERHTWEDAELIKQEIEDDDYLVVSGFRYSDFEEFVDNISKLKRRLMDFLYRFYNQVFLPEKSYIMGVLEKEITKAEYLLREDERLFVQSLFKVNKDYYLNPSDYKAFIYISVCSPNITSYTVEKDQPKIQYLILGASVIDQVRGEVNEMLVRLLGEPTKLSIVKLLTKKPMYASEIAAELELERTTIAHHLNQLSKTGAVDSAYSKGNKIYYKANIRRIEKGFQHFLEQLQSEID